MPKQLPALAAHEHALTGPVAVAEHLRDLADGVEEARRKSRASGTLRGYDVVRRQFEEWCASVHVTPWPTDPRVLVLWLEELRRSGYALGTIVSRHYVVGGLNRQMGFETPCRSLVVQETLAGFRRDMARSAPKDALTAELVLRMLPVGDGPQAVRDRALLLLGLAGGFRRSEICALDLDDLRWTDQGLVVSVRRSKTDQEGRGAQVEIWRAARDPRLCAPTAVERWCALVRERGGPEVFRPIRKDGMIRHRRLTPDGFRRVVVGLAERAGLALDYDVTAHSLRAGLATELSLRGVPIESIMRQGRWTSRDTVLGYVRYEEFANEATRVF